MVFYSSTCPNMSQDVGNYNLTHCVVHYVGSSEQFGTQPECFILLGVCVEAEPVWLNTKPIKSKDMIDS